LITLLTPLDSHETLPLKHMYGEKHRLKRNSSIETCSEMYRDDQQRYLVLDTDSDTVYRIQI
jgi:hypothetical protein